MIAPFKRSSRNYVRTLPVLALAAILAAACGDGTGPSGANPELAVRFSTAATAAANVAPEGFQLAAEGDSLVIEGTNGTLVLDDVHVIVAEFELDRANTDGCVEDNDACEKFTSPPIFLRVPLAGTTAPVVEQSVPPDTYDELEFEIEDLDDDEEDPVLAQQIDSLRQVVLTEFPDWPWREQASVRIEGAFTPDGGSPTEFVAYFRAEIEVELEFQPPITITADGESDPSVTVVVDPSIWFTQPDGSVRNLALSDFSGTGEVVRFEAEFENGFRDLEFHEGG